MSDEGVAAVEPAKVNVDRAKANVDRAKVMIDPAKVMIDPAKVRDARANVAVDRAIVRALPKILAVDRGILTNELANPKDHAEKPKVDEATVKVRKAIVAGDPAYERVIGANLTIDPADVVEARDKVCVPGKVLRDGRANDEGDSAIQQSARENHEAHANKAMEHAAGERSDRAKVKDARANHAVRLDTSKVSTDGAPFHAAILRDAEKSPMDDSAKLHVAADNDEGERANTMVRRKILRVPTARDEDARAIEACARASLWDDQTKLTEGPAIMSDGPDNVSERRKILTVAWAI